MIDPNYEGEITVVEVKDDEGNTTYYEEDVIIPLDDKNFAALISLPEKEGEEDFEPEIIIARIEKDDEDGVSYVEPTEEEYNAVVDIYSKMLEEMED